MKGGGERGPPDQGCTGYKHPPLFVPQCSLVCPSPLHHQALASCLPLPPPSPVGGVPQPPVQLLTKKNNCVTGASKRLRRNGPQALWVSWMARIGSAGEGGLPLFKRALEHTRCAGRNGFMYNCWHNTLNQTLHSPPPPNLLPQWSTQQPHSPRPDAACFVRPLSPDQVPPALGGLCTARLF
jgi:hypothetical protein